MTKTRLEAFSDGVLAIIITILVLELKVPHGETFAVLKPLLPFVTGWMGENHFAAMPTALYGCVLLVAAVAYWILQRSIIAAEGQDSVLARAIGRDRKGNVSVLVYAAAIPVAFFSHWVSQACYVVVALLWLVPDKRIERALAAHDR